MSSASSETPFKRKYPRRGFQRAVGFLFHGVYFVGMGAKIGEGGISFVLPKDFPLFHEGVASFQLPDGEFVCLRVEIRNSFQNPISGKWTIGCAFKNLKFEIKREIRSFVSARTDLEH